ncbi:MAG: hypothetical protein IPF92_10665 [Myxococcales bacterium]|jgi:hypothetical protein|nr:hypothetical protein [Myxococcales bacterium]MBL0198458.1 hypothetical protein [Myxococcales bacterium]HQY62922.1 hypothetical protein [Polyangiaceae bacterium]
MPLVRLRAHFLAAMGLSAAGCNDVPPATSPQPQAPPTVAAPTVAPRTGTDDASTEAGATGGEPTGATDAGSANAGSATGEPSLPDAGAPPRPDASAPASTLVAAPAWYVTFPRRKNPESWCPTEQALCVDGAKELAKCPLTHTIPCGRGLRYEAPDLQCEGELMRAITQTQRRRHPLACCYDAHARCIHPGEGRPYRPSGGEAVVAELSREPSAWSSDEPTRAPAPDEARAEEWWRAGLLEHASIASFAKLSLDLLAHGAPPDLLRRTHEAARDEIAHAELCFTIAERLSGLRRGPGPLVSGPLVSLDLRALARETFVDGCIGETLAALAARERSAAAHDHEERRALLTIAEDEERHAALAWAIVAWAAERDPACLDALSDASCGDPVVRAQIVAPCLQALREATSREVAPRPVGANG